MTNVAKNILYVSFGSCTYTFMLEFLGVQWLGHRVCIRSSAASITKHNFKVNLQSPKQYMSIPVPTHPWKFMVLPRFVLF